MKTKIICMTPVKNEAWILKRFLTCASLWADHIIVADQDSSDTSREIAASFPKVILIENPSAVFNEPQRQKMLIDEARKIAGPKILIALDADEMLPPGAWESPEWRTMLESPPGTVILFRWANICHGWRQMWISDSVFPGGYVDDGASHEGRDIHSPRVPCPEGANGVEMTETKVLHLQYTDWQRMESKHRWYQVWERLNQPEQNPVSLYRRYHHMFAVPRERIIPVPDEWKKSYSELGLDITSVNKPSHLWWDKEVLDLFEKHGTQKFKSLNIWNISWELMARRQGLKHPERYRDPRGFLIKGMHRLMAHAQRNRTIPSFVLWRIASLLWR